MSQENYEKWTDMAKKMQAPFQEIAQLNLKTLQNLSYIKPEELATIKRPDEFFERQLECAIENGQKALKHMEDSFEIIKKTLLLVSQETKKAGKKVEENFHQQEEAFKKETSRKRK